LMDPKTKRAEILVANADGSDAKKITVAEEKEIAFGASWSPDGQRLAYSVMKIPEDGPPSNIALMVGDADGKNAKKLSEGMIPAWSPDGKRILYTVLGMGADFDVHLHLMDADGKNDKELFKGKSMMGTYSQDGKRIVYMAGKEGKREMPRIHVCNADGSEPTQVTTGEDQFELAPRWSADGKRIFFNRMKALR
jgi:Tol biopolymer transport system component